MGLAARVRAIVLAISAAGLAVCAGEGHAVSLEAGAQGPLHFAGAACEFAGPDGAQLRSGFTVLSGVELCEGHGGGALLCAAGRLIVLSDYLGSGCSVQRLALSATSRGCRGLVLADDLLDVPGAAIVGPYVLDGSDTAELSDTFVASVLRADWRALAAAAGGNASITLARSRTIVQDNDWYAVWSSALFVALSRGVLAVLAACAAGVTAWQLVRRLAWQRRQHLAKQAPAAGEPSPRLSRVGASKLMRSLFQYICTCACLTASRRHRGAALGRHAAAFFGLSLDMLDMALVLEMALGLTRLVYVLVDPLASTHVLVGARAYLMAAVSMCVAAPHSPALPQPVLTLTGARLATQPAGCRRQHDDQLVLVRSQRAAGQVPAHASPRRARPCAG